MCQGIEWKYAVCKHPKNLEITNLCVDAFQSDGSKCDCDFQDKAIESPMLCTTCRYEQEILICDHFDRKLSENQHQLDVLDYQLRLLYHLRGPTERLEARTCLAPLEKYQKSMLEHRRSTIEWFRQSFGLPVDGVPASLWGS